MAFHHATEKMMLILTRNPNERIILSADGEPIAIIQALEPGKKGDPVSLGITANKGLWIDREEIFVSKYGDILPKAKHKKGK